MELFKDFLAGALLIGAVLWIVYLLAVFGGFEIFFILGLALIFIAASLSIGTHIRDN